MRQFAIQQDKYCFIFKVLFILLVISVCNKNRPPYSCSDYGYQQRRTLIVVVVVVNKRSVLSDIKQILAN